MEVIFVLVIIIGLIVYAISNDKKDKSAPINQDYEISSSFNQSDQYEDPYLRLNFDSENERDEIFHAPYPFFHALNDHSFISIIEEKLKPTANLLSKISDDDLRSAIISLIDQDYFRTKLGLPKYLQMVPVEKLIKDGILIQPNEQNINELLNSMTMKELRIKCDEIGIKSARSKKETVDRLVDSKESLGLNFDNYFMISPVVQKLHSKFNKYCLEILDQDIDKNKILVAEVNRKLDRDELREYQKVGNYKIQEYGYGSLILFKEEKPLFRIFEYNLNKYSGRSTVTLLNNGILLLNDIKYLGGSTVGLVILLNDKKEELFQFRLINPDYNGLKEIGDQNFVYCNMKDETIWILNTDTFEHKFLNNPTNKNIYSLIEEF